MYSPAALSMSHGKPLFLIYQLLQLSRDLHDKGLVLGEITLSDILIMDNFTIQVNIYMFFILDIFYLFNFEIIITFLDFILLGVTKSK